MKILDKRVGSAIWITGMIFMIIAIKNNPTDSDSKLHIMRDDMRAILLNGGIVAINSYNSKYGGAYFYTGIEAKSWSPILANSYSRSLLKLGWKEQNDDGGVFFCKDGILAKVHRDIEHGEGKSIYGVSMTYNALTIRKCDDR